MLDDRHHDHDHVHEAATTAGRSGDSAGTRRCCRSVVACRTSTTNVEAPAIAKKDLSKRRGADLQGSVKKG
jgi:hypothetical protein